MHLLGVFADTCFPSTLHDHMQKILLEESDNKITGLQ
jgi:hypothetical protein